MHLIQQPQFHSRRAFLRRSGQLAMTVTLTPNQYRSEVRFSGCLLALQAGLKASLQGKFVWRAPV
jgi:hypothetical protein